MNKSSIQISSNKSFGLVFFIFFLIVSLYPILNDESIRIWALTISIVFLILGLLNSKVLSPFNKLWFKFGIILGKFISPIIMGITPTSLTMKLIGKNLLNLKRNNKNTYWIKRDKLKSKMKNQF